MSGDARRRLEAALREIERHCPCGARPESPRSHPHVGGCPVAEAIEAAAALPAEPPNGDAGFRAPVDAKEWTCPTCGNDGLWCKCPLPAEPPPSLVAWLRHHETCDAAAWEQRNRVHAPNYERRACTCGLDAALAATRDAEPATMPSFTAGDVVVYESDTAAERPEKD